MITLLQFRHALSIVDGSGAADLLERLMYPNPQGRRGPLSQRAFLVGMLLTLMTTGTALYREIHELLARRLPIAAQIELGIVTATDNGDGTTTVERTVEEDHFYTFTRKLRSVMRPNEPLGDDIHRALLDITDRLLAETLPDRPKGATTYAVDETGHWAHSLGRKDREPAPDTEAGPGHDTEAGWSGKTAKDGTTEWYFGWSIHAIVRAPAVGKDGSSEPLLLEALDLTAAGTDLVDPTLHLLDRMLDRGLGVGDLLGDRHYSYKQAERWAVPLRDHGIRQVLDLRADEHGFHDVDGTRVTAGSPHCPATPDVYAKHVRPAPADDPTPEDFRRFEDFIEARQQWALQRRSTPWASKIRYSCPARSGTLGCALVEGSDDVAREVGLPIVENPPDPTTAPKCCTQRTVTLDAAAIGEKHIQERYWGSAAWYAAYRKRTHVESWFGTAKNPSKSTVSRQASYADCRGLRLLYVAVAATATNLLLLRRWHEQHGESRQLEGIDPLLVDAEPDDRIRIVPTAAIAA